MKAILEVSKIILLTEKQKFPIELNTLTSILKLRDNPHTKAKFLSYCADFPLHELCSLTLSYTYINKLGQKVSSFKLTETFAKSFCSHVDSVKGYKYTKVLERKAKEADSLRVQLLEAKIAKLEAPKKLNEWQPLRWFLQESNVSGHLDKFTNRVNYRTIRNEVFDRDIKKGYADMVKFNGKALLFNPEYENEIKKILLDVD